MQKKAFKEGIKIMQDDRIHPLEEGAVLMAQTFLKAQGYDIHISDDLHYLKTLSSQKFSPWEEKRYKMEQDKQCIEYVVWCEFCGIKDKNIIKSEIEKRIKTQTNEFIINCYNGYLSSSDELVDKQMELKEYTKNYVYNM